MRSTPRDGRVCIRMCAEVILPKTKRKVANEITRHLDESLCFWMPMV